MILRQIILGGLLLPFKLYFQPSRFVNEINDLAPELPRGYNLRQARHKLREPEFRRKILIILAQVYVAMFWAVVMLCSFSVLSFKIRWINLTVVGAIGIAGGVLFGITESVAVGVAGAVAFGIAGGIGGGIAVGIEGSIGAGIAVGVAVGVAISIAFGLSRGIAFGAAFNLAFGAVLCVTESVAVGGAVSIISIVTISHLLIYPIQSCLSGLSWMISRMIPLPIPHILWRLSPARWDEVVILPLPGLSRLLTDLYRHDSKLGIEAIDEILQHRYQNRSAFQALAKIAFEEARQLDTLPAMASYERGLDWLDSETRLPVQIKTPLLLLKDLSQMIDAAQQSDTARNRISQLRTAEEKAHSLRQYPAEFGPVLVKWQKLIAEGLTKAEEERRTLEPIRQVYFNDGKPISPDELPEDESPFKGRMQTVRELEGALADSKRMTLLLTGNRRSGKSSLLLQLPRKLGPQVLPVFLDCQSARFASSESATGLLTGMAEEIINEVRRNSEKFRRNPIRFSWFDRGAFRDDPYPAFARWLDGVERALGGRQLLLCLDEYEKLEEALAAGRIDGRFLSMLRNIIQHHHRIIVLLAGSHQLDELPPRWADALVTTQSLKIGFLDEADARELIVQPVKGFPEIYRPEAVDRILALTHSQPYLVQLICGLLVEKMNRERREPPASYVSLDDIGAVIPLALDRGEAYFNDLWRSQTGGNLARRILERLAFAESERVSSPEIRQLTEDQEALGDTIRTLLRREIIEPTADGYHITVPLIGYYVRSQRQPI